ncbi:MAG: GAP family protein [Gaiellaceae bacterium]
MAGVIALVLSIAALDALNPSTVLPALVLATGPSARRRVLAFTAGVFIVSTLGGILLLFAVGRPVLDHVAHPSAHTRHLVELALGVGLVCVGAVLWVLRGRVRRTFQRDQGGRGRSALALGAGIMAIELPTAFPYFAAILATADAAHGVAAQTALVVAFNAVFVAPLVAILAVATTQPRLEAASARIRRWAPVAFPIGVATAGIVLATIGARGL